jgi:hypothetical protein
MMNLLFIQFCSDICHVFCLMYRYVIDGIIEVHIWSETQQRLIFLKITNIRFNFPILNFDSLNFSLGLCDEFYKQLLQSPDIAFCFRFGAEIDSSSGIVRNLRAGRTRNCGFDFRRGQYFSFLSKCPDGSGAHLASYSVTTGGISQS